MKKQDLKTFMRVKTRNDITYIVTGDLAIECDGSNLNLLDDYDENLQEKDRDFHDYDIVEIYDKPSNPLVLEHDYKGDLLWKRPEFKPMKVHVPYPWMWEEVEKWAANNSITWHSRSSSSHNEGYGVFRQNSIIRITGEKKMYFEGYNPVDINVISFADFCEKTGHEPEKWGVRGSEDNAPLIKDLFRSCGSAIGISLDLPYCLYGISKHNRMINFHSSEATEITIGEAYRKMGKRMPEPVQEQEIEIDGKMFSVSTIKNALKSYCND